MKNSVYELILAGLKNELLIQQAITKSFRRHTSPTDLGPNYIKISLKKEVLIKETIRYVDKTLRNCL